jgi:hypothetical protein
VESIVIEKPFSPLHHSLFTQRVKVEWNASGTAADVYFLTEDGNRQFVLTMSAQVLELLREDIADALANKPGSTRR